MEREPLPKPDILQIDEAATEPLPLLHPMEERDGERRRAGFSGLPPSPRSSPHSFVVDEEENVRGNSTTLVAGQQT